MLLHRSGVITIRLFAWLAFMLCSVALTAAAAESPAPNSAPHADAATSPAPAPQWTVSAPLTPLSLEPNERLRINVSVTSGTLTGLQLWQPALVETTTRRALSTGVALCSKRTIDSDDPTKPCGGSKNEFSGPITGNVILWMDTTGDAGQYDGSLLFVAANSPDVKTVPTVTIYVSTMGWKLCGILWIAFGVIVAWLTTVWIRNVINRTQMLLPASALTSSLHSFQNRLTEKRPAGLTTLDLDAKIIALLAKLTESALQANGLPQYWVPPPWSTATVSTVTTYNTYIAAITDWVNDLALIVNGCERAFQVYDPNDSTKVALVKRCLAQLDSLVQGEPAPPLQQLATNVTSALAGLQPVVPGNRALTAEPAPSGGLPPVPRLEVQLSLIIYAAWAIISIATVALGAYVLLFSSAGNGFGTPRDYLTCFLWGLGLPAGASLLQGSTSTVTTAFNVTRQ